MDKFYNQKRLKGWMPMKFPVIDEGQVNNINSDHICPICSKNKIDSSEKVILNAGGIIDSITESKIQKGIENSEGSLGIHYPLTGFWNIAWHCLNISKEKNVTAVNLEIVNFSKLGQFDLYFCSTHCLRVFFNAIVDEMERIIESGNLP